MYKTRDNLIFGFHGCDETLCDKLVSGQITALNYSKNSYDWLGKGMYFGKMTQKEHWNGQRISKNTAKIKIKK